MDTGVYFLQLERPGKESALSPPSGTDIRNEWSATCSLLGSVCLHGVDSLLSFRCFQICRYMACHYIRPGDVPSIGPKILLYFQLSAFIQVVYGQHMSPSTKCMHFLRLHVGAHCKLIEFTVSALINGLFPSRNFSLCVYTLYNNSVFQNIV
jgi:hypothetical protein